MVGILPESKAHTDDCRATQTPPNVQKLKILQHPNVAVVLGLGLKSQVLTIRRWH